MPAKLLNKCGCNTLYQVGGWYVMVNKKTRKCFMTSGDMWFSVTRTETVEILFGRAG